jgi:hypothetical protein
MELPAGRIGFGRLWPAVAGFGGDAGARSTSNNLFMGVCMFNSAKAMLCLEPSTVTPVGATDLLGGVVEMLTSPPFARLRRKLCFQVYLEPMMAAQPCVAPLLEGIIEKLARFFCSVGGDVMGMLVVVVRPDWGRRWV